MVYFSNCSCNNANANQIHKEEVAQALKDAKESYLREHPEERDLVLKYNPEQHLAPTKGKTISYDVCIFLPLQ